MIRSSSSSAIRYVQCRSNSFDAFFNWNMVDMVADIWRMGDEFCTLTFFPGKNLEVQKLKQNSSTVNEKIVENVVQQTHQTTLKKLDFHLFTESKVCCLLSLQNQKFVCLAWFDSNG